MNHHPPIWIVAFALLAFNGELRAVTPDVRLQAGVSVSWPTEIGNTYQAQWASQPTGPWNDLGTALVGTGASASVYDAETIGSRYYQVEELIPGTDPGTATPVNGSFESGSGTDADSWSLSANQPPTRSGDDAKSGSFCMRCALVNVGTTPAEGLLRQKVVERGGEVIGGQSYDFSFWAKQVSTGPSFVQQYEVRWLDSAGGSLGGSGLENFSASEGVWTELSAPGLVAPANATDARISFRLVTGAVAGGHGEVLIDDVLLDPGTEVVPDETRILSASSVAVNRLEWSTVVGTEYFPFSSSDLATWTSLGPALVGDGEPQSLSIPKTQPREFYRIDYPIDPVSPPTSLRTSASGDPGTIALSWDASATVGVTGYRIVYRESEGGDSQSLDLGNVTSSSISGLTSGQIYIVSVIALTAEGASPEAAATISVQPDIETGITPLFNTSTPLEPATTIETPTALITRVADRARDRHAREDEFDSYDHYLPWYWEERTIAIEIIDEVAKGGSEITFNYTTLTPLGAAEFRAFYRGINTVAEYHLNLMAELVGPNQYTATIDEQLPDYSDLEIGDRIEVEISQFLQAPTNGRTNYYGTTFLYIVGQGIVPWQAIGPLQDSYPLPETAWLGGQTTLPYQYSNEPEHRFKQTAGNIAPISAQPFMLGRRLHHTDFDDGSHSESGNPVYSEQVGKLGPSFIGRSCVECHTNNGRALPPAIDAPMLQSVVKVGSDALGSPHPLLGSVLQPQSTTGSPEAVATIASYTETSGQFTDGSSYSLRKPNYAFQGVTPDHFSVRVAPPLVGLGLLEAVDESTIMALADPGDADSDGISGRARTVSDPETGELRLGRFDTKAGKARLSHQIAAALNTDMGVTSSVFPNLDGESSSGTPELADLDLEKLTRYIALLGVGARRDLGDADALNGEQLFSSAGCIQCHTSNLTTGAYHPMTELRNQTVHPYTDLLLHDMGEGLADNMGENGASGSEWRTPPLWGIGFTAGVSGGEAYLHDGRARSLDEAILWHGGEADASKENFRALSAADRAALIKFLQSL